MISVDSRGMRELEMRMMELMSLKVMGKKMVEEGAFGGTDGALE